MSDARRASSDASTESQTETGMTKSFTCPPDDDGTNLNIEDMTVANYNVIFSIWINEIKQSCDSLQRRAFACKHYPVGGPDNDNRQASLVISFNAAGVENGSAGTGIATHSADSAGVRVLWIHWIDSTNLLGKPFSLDTSGGIIYAPNFVKNEERFRHIIHPAIGATMRRSRERESVPHDVRRLKTMCEVAFAPPTTGFNHGDDEQCFICSNVFGEKHAVLDESNVQSDFRCMICLLHSHRKCCQSVLHFLDKFGNKSDGTSPWPDAGFDKAKHDLRNVQVSGFSLDMVPAVLLHLRRGESDPQIERH